MSGEPPTQAMVLAAGLGLRMRPLTETRPKPLLEVGGRTMLDLALDRLVEAGTRRAVINLHWLGDQIEAHLEGRNDLQIAFTHEDPVLETGGGILNALSKNVLRSEALLALNADQIWIDGATPALEHLASVWNQNTMDALLMLCPRESAFGYDGLGDFNLLSGGKLERRRAGAMGEHVFTGVQILHPRIFDGLEGIKAGDPFSLNVAFERAIQTGRLFGVVHQGDWLHIGTPDALADASAFIKDKTNKSEQGRNRG